MSPRGWNNGKCGLDSYSSLRAHSRYLHTGKRGKAEGPGGQGHHGRGNQLSLPLEETLELWLYPPVPWGCEQILPQGPSQARFRVCVWRMGGHPLGKHHPPTTGLSHSNSMYLQGAEQPWLPHPQEAMKAPKDVLLPWQLMGIQQAPLPPPLPARAFLHFPLLDGPRAWKKAAGTRPITHLPLWAAQAAVGQDNLRWPSLSLLDASPGVRPFCGSPPNPLAGPGHRTGLRVGGHSA